ncbi:hypothetical protein JTB14_019451 [Gonioctena quinquepunctata]|nr:hypothetical protein JTB14_019451 [Gonioctena quinquepunctata]
MHSDTYSKSDDSGIVNILYNPKLLVEILDRYMSIQPLWSALITKTRLSNALEERWFGFLKHNSFNGAKYLPPSLFIRKVRAHVEEISKETSLGINKERLAAAREKKICL